jgi:glycosidase
MLFTTIYTVILLVVFFLRKIATLSNNRFSRKQNQLNSTWLEGLTLKLNRFKNQYSMKNILLFLVFCLVHHTSCNKTATVTPITPPVVVVENPDADPVAFGVPFTGVPVTKDVAMYEVNMRAFSAEGNFKGVQARLDSIKALGITVLWLMPIHPIGVLKNAGGLGSPYSVKDYKAVNSEFGTIEDLQNLVIEAHKRNMAVIIDWVGNHTSWDNAWVTVHPDWYSKDASGNIIIPAGTNWADVADLNYSNADMRKAMIKAMKYWILKANIDGFRCDYADGVPVDFWKQASDSLKTLPNRKYVMLAEGSLGEQISAGFAMNYSWDFYTQIKDVYKKNLAASLLFNVHNYEYSNLPSGGVKLRYTTNHDQSAWEDSPITLLNGKAGSMSAFVLATYIGGVPLLYNGQEVGRADKTPFFTKSPINWNSNPDIFTEYKRLMTFRQSSDAVKEGSLSVINDDVNVVVFKRIFQNEEVLVLVNTQNSVSTYNTATALKNTIWKNALDNTSLTLSATVSLQPYQYLILKK